MILSEVKIDCVGLDPEDIMTCILNTIFRPGKMNLRTLRMLAQHGNTRLFSFHGYQRTVSYYGYQNTNSMKLQCVECMVKRAYGDTLTNIKGRNLSSVAGHVMTSHPFQHRPLTLPSVGVDPSAGPHDRQCFLQPIVRCVSNGKGQSSHNGERENRRIKRLTLLIGNIF